MVWNSIGGMKTPKKTIDNYFKRPDSPTMLAVASGLGINTDMLRHWRHGHAGRMASAFDAVRLEYHSGGGMLADHIRPDLAWVRIPDRRWPVASGRPLLDLAKSKRRACRSSGV